MCRNCGKRHGNPTYKELFEYDADIKYLITKSETLLQVSSGTETYGKNK
jgi:hypothetical protein